VGRNEKWERRPLSRRASRVEIGEAGADVLLRVEQPEKPSRMGNWSYEVVDWQAGAGDQGRDYSPTMSLFGTGRGTARHRGRNSFTSSVRVSALQLESYRLSAFAGILPCLLKVNLLGVVKAGSADTYLSRSATAISAGGGKNATDSAAVMIICRSLLELLNCSGKN